MITFFAPPARCAPALALEVNRPVHSSTTSTPCVPHGISAGLRTAYTLMRSPLTIRSPPSADTVPGNLPCAVSYWVRCALVAASPRSLIATTWISLAAAGLVDRAQDVAADAAVAVDRDLDRHDCSWFAGARPDSDGETAILARAAAPAQVSAASGPAQSRDPAASPGASLLAAQSPRDKLEAMRNLLIALLLFSFASQACAWGPAATASSPTWRRGNCVRRRSRKPGACSPAKPSRPWPACPPGPTNCARQAEARPRDIRALALRQFPRGQCAVRARARLRRMATASSPRSIASSWRLADRRRPDAERREALKFLVHFVGDVHQPLHASSRPDKGGNDFQVSLRGKGSNLHSRLGLADHRSGERATRSEPPMRDLLADRRRCPPTRRAAPIGRRWTGRWRPAAWSTTATSIRRRTSSTTTTSTRSGRWSRQRLRQAGARLADMLNFALAPRPRPRLDERRRHEPRRANDCPFHHADTGTWSYRGRRSRHARGRDHRSGARLRREGPRAPARPPRRRCSTRAREHGLRGALDPGNARPRRPPVGRRLAAATSAPARQIGIGAGIRDVQATLQADLQPRARISRSTARSSTACSPTASASRSARSRSQVIATPGPHQRQPELSDRRRRVRRRLAVHARRRHRALRFPRRRRRRPVRLDPSPVRPARRDPRVRLPRLRPGRPRSRRADHASARRRPATSMCAPTPAKPSSSTLRRTRDATLGDAGADHSRGAGQHPRRRAARARGQRRALPEAAARQVVAAILGHGACHRTGFLRPARTAIRSPTRSTGCLRGRSEVRAGRAARPGQAAPPAQRAVRAHRPPIRARPAASTPRCRWIRRPPARAWSAASSSPSCERHFGADFPRLAYVRAQKRDALPATSRSRSSTCSRARCWTREQAQRALRPASTTPMSRARWPSAAINVLVQKVARDPPTARA